MANLRSAPLFENLQEIQAQRGGCIFAEGRSFLLSPFPLPSRCSQKRTYNTLFTLFQSGFLLPRGRGFFGELFRGKSQKFEFPVGERDSFRRLVFLYLLAIPACSLRTESGKHARKLRGDLLEISPNVTSSLGHGRWDSARFGEHSPHRSVVDPRSKICFNISFFLCICRGNFVVRVTRTQLANAAKQRVHEINERDRISVPREIPKVSTAAAFTQHTFARMRSASSRLRCQLSYRDFAATRWRGNLLFFLLFSSTPLKTERKLLHFWTRDRETFNTFATIGAPPLKETTSPSVRCTDRIIFRVCQSVLRVFF